MKKFHLVTILAFTLTLLPASGQILADLEFDTDTTGDWNAVADASSQPAEVSKLWLSGVGNPAGSMELTGFNTVDGIGRAYIWQYIGTGLNYGGDVEVTFDLLLTDPINGAAIHFLSDNPGAGFVPSFDLQNQGLNDTTWTSYSVPISGITPGTATFEMRFQIAAGAFTGAGAGIAVDNVTVSAVPEPATYAALVGLLALGVVVWRRRVRRS